MLYFHLGLDSRGFASSVQLCCEASCRQTQLVFFSDICLLYPLSIMELEAFQDACCTLKMKKLPFFLIKV